MYWRIWRVRMDELINLEELLEEEEAYVKRIFGKLDDSNLQVNPGLVGQILKTASTF